MIIAEIQVVFNQHRGFYGSHRIQQELRAAGHPVGRHGVARLTQRAGLRAKSRWAWPPFTQTNSRAAQVAQSLLHHAFLFPAANRCWAGNITNPRTTAGSRYLADWMDLFSRCVVGWPLGISMGASLVLEALQ